MSNDFQYIADDLSEALTILLTRKGKALALSADQAKYVYRKVWNVEATLTDLGLINVDPITKEDINVTT
tara:strand:+ start:365 stop:571 length:207 start_codon:yes stop_codon:yes gene_type:complete